MKVSCNILPWFCSTRGRLNVNTAMGNRKNVGWIAKKNGQIQTKAKGNVTVSK